MSGLALHLDVLNVQDLDVSQEVLGFRENKSHLSLATTDVQVLQDKVSTLFTVVIDELTDKVYVVQACVLQNQFRVVVISVEFGWIVVHVVCAIWINHFGLIPYDLASNFIVLSALLVNFFHKLSVY